MVVILTARHQYYIQYNTKSGRAITSFHLDKEDDLETRIH